MNAEERSVAKDHNLVRDICLGSAAASIATIFSNPMEVCKTRLQLQGEMQTRSAERLTRQYSNMFDAFYKIARYEGVRGLQGGLVPAIAFQSVMNGFRLGSYEFINTALRKADPKDKYFSLQNALVAACVGGTGAFLGNPFFLVKVRMQTRVRTVPVPVAAVTGPTAAALLEASGAAAAGATGPGALHAPLGPGPVPGALGAASASITGAATAATTGAGAVPVVAAASTTASASTSASASASAGARPFSSGAAKPIGIQYNYSGMFDAFRSIIREEGARGLLRGSTVASMRVGFGSAAQFSCYEKCKVLFAEHSSLRGMALHFASSSLAAVAVTVTMNPFDVVTTRLYNQNKTSGAYSSAADVVRKMLATEGPRGLFKGLLPHYARMGPHMIIMFIAWEKLKMFFKPPKKVAAI